MSIRPPRPAATEQVVSALSGWPMLIVNLLLFAFAAYLIVFAAEPGSALRLAGPALALLGLLMLGGYFTLQPNQARVLILFGAYKGTVRESGFHWANPFYSRTHGSDPGKRAPADEGGNPVEIAAVVVWRVENTAQAVFDVEDYGSYVEMQSESAIRSIASRYAYDQGEDHEITLRGGADEVALALKEELEVRLAKAGVIVEEARLTHLAYAPEIAPVMLRRQQAEAIIAARKIIVQNAVTMVHMALEDLDQKNVVKLDDERKAAMVSNLLVVLCGNSDASPVINTGTLYT